MSEHWLVIDVGNVWEVSHTLELDSIYCILASCYIRLTLNICSFVHQCNTFTSGEYTITPEDGLVRPKHVDD
jgi:hypothetical protein